MEDNNMKELLQKAEVLIEALPYIQRFNRKIIVVKYGGSAMVDEELKKHVIQDVTLLKLVGFKPIMAVAKKSVNGLAKSAWSLYLSMDSAKRTRQPWRSPRWY